MIIILKDVRAFVHLSILTQSNLKAHYTPREMFIIIERLETGKIAEEINHSRYP